MVVAMDAMAVAIHIKYLVGQNEHLTFYSPESISGLLCAPRRPMNIISLDFVQFIFRLLSSAQV